MLKGFLFYGLEFIYSHRESVWGWMYIVSQYWILPRRMGWDWIVGYLTSHEASYLCVGNRSGHNLHTHEDEVRGRWRASPTGIRTQYHQVFQEEQTQLHVTSLPWSLLIYRTLFTAYVTSNSSFSIHLSICRMQIFVTNANYVTFPNSSAEWSF